MVSSQNGTSAAKKELTRNSQIKQAQAPSASPKPLKFQQENKRLQR